MFFDVDAARNKAFSYSILEKISKKNAHPVWGEMLRLLARFALKQDAPSLVDEPNEQW